MELSITVTELRDLTEFLHENTLPRLHVSLNNILVERIIRHRLQAPFEGQAKVFRC